MQETAARYRNFADHQATESPSLQRLARAVADDPDLCGRLDALPWPKRQPNLYFAAVRYLGGPVDDPAEFRAYSRRHWDTIVDQIRRRRTQTNEVGRCATLLPLLAALPQPLALVEVGASAGLCLYPDRYRYRYGSHHVGPADSGVVLDCAVTGPAPLPAQPPHIAWRAGLDLNPLDIRDADTRRWLEALVWPEHTDRLDRLRAAAAIAAADPPTLHRGDLLTDVPALAAQAPAGATLVVVHSAALVYVEPEQRREEFADAMRRLPGQWISQEGAAVLPSLLPQGHGAAGERMVLALDGRAVAFAHPHGRHLTWR